MPTFRVTRQINGEMRTFTVVARNAADAARKADSVAADYRKEASR